MADTLKKPKDLRFLSKIRVLASEIYEDVTTYLSRTYSQSSSIFSVASPFAQILKVLAELFELNMFYVEDATLEQNILTATTAESIYGLSVLAGHNPTRAISALGEIRFKFKPGKESDFIGSYILMPNNTKIKCKNNNLNYLIRFNQDFIKIDKNNIDYINAQIIQGEIESQTVYGTGLSMQSFNFNVNGQAEHYNVKVYVNSELWSNYSSLYDMRNDTKGCLIKSGLSGGLDIFFGNGYFGKVPGLGSIIKIEYILTKGSVGTIIGDTDYLTFEYLESGINSLGEEVDLNQYMLTEAVTTPKFGSNAENTQFTKIIAPLASKSFVLISPENYQYFLSRYNNLSYIEAYNTYNDEYLDDDNIVYLFLLPDVKSKLTSGNDYFTIDENEFTLDNDEIKMLYSVLNESGNEGLSSEVDIVEPIIKKYAVTVILRYFEGFQTETISKEIRTQLNDYFLTVNRRDKIPKSDLIAIIEGIEGIDSVNVYFTSKENEAAIANGYYYKEYTKVEPTTPFLQEGEGNKKRYIFFNKEIIKTKINLTANEDPNLGLDEFGDITIGQNELPIIRGGWNDRYGNYYDEEPKQAQPSSLTIYFKDQITQTISSRIQTANKKKLT
jgi:hypothetical protein